MEFHDATDEGTHTMWEATGVGDSGTISGTDHGLDDLAGGALGRHGQAHDTEPATDHDSASGGSSSGEASGGSGTMTVEVDGQTRTLPTTTDYTGDGRPDAAVETPDGNVIIFTDTENNTTGNASPDGKADQAFIINTQTGTVEGTAHIDPHTGEWVDGQDTTNAGTGTTGPGDTTRATPTRVTPVLAVAVLAVAVLAVAVRAAAVRAVVPVPTPAATPARPTPAPETRGTAARLGTDSEGVSPRRHPFGRCQRRPAGAGWVGGRQPHAGRAGG
jgi:hypothetical protein